MSYLRITVIGQFGISENWTNTYSYAFFGLVDNLPDQAMVDGISSRLASNINTAAVPASLLGLLSAGGTINAWRVEKMDETDRVLSVSTATLVTPITGTGVVNKNATDCLVISLRTNTPGPSGRGRFYWPALVCTLNGTAFNMTSPAPATVVADGKTWLKAIGDQANAYFAGISSAVTVVLSVRSIKQHQNHNVVRLQVGNILDTQRRRRDKLVESYSAVAYP